MVQDLIQVLRMFQQTLVTVTTSVPLIVAMRDATVHVGSSIMKIIYMKKIQLISLTTYCSKAKVWSAEDMIIYHTKLEDEVNHPYQPIQIPELKYPTSFKKDTVGMWNFFKGCLP